MIGTILGLITVGPIVLPWLSGMQHWLHRQSLRLGHASRHTFVVWTRNINVITAAIVLAVFIFTTQLFFRAGVSFPVWCWLPQVVILGLMIVCRILDQFVLANGTGTTDRHVLKTLGIALGGTFADAWHLRWVGCELKAGLDHRFPDPRHIDWVVDIAQDLGLIALFLMMILTAIWSFVMNWSAAIIRVVAQFEYFVLGAKNLIVAALRVDKDLEAYIEELVAKFPHGNEAATMIFLINTVNQGLRLPAFALLDTMLVIYWMDFGIAKKITVAFLLATAVHMIWTLALRDSRNRVTVPPWYTFVVPFGLVTPYIGYWLARGPYRQSLGEVPVFHEIGQMMWRLTHMPPITAFLFLLALGLAFAGLAWGGKKVDATFELKNKWARFGVLIVPSLFFLPVIGGQLFSLAATDIATPAVAFTRDWSISAAWATGKPLFLLLVVFTVVMSVKAWQMGKDGDKRAWMVAVPMLCGIGFFTVVGISAGYVVDAPAGAGPGVYVLGTSGAGNCVQAWQTPNGPSQCCAGTAYQPPPRAMCVPLGQ